MATTEVAEALEALEFLQEVNVYGVSVPGARAWGVGAGARPTSLSWYGGRRGHEATTAEPFPNPCTPQDTKAGLEWQPWCCVAPTLWTWCSSTPMLLRTCHLMPGLGFSGFR